MDHVLDNPAWSALTLGNKNLSNGTVAVKYFDKQVSPFVAFEEISNENFNTLHDLLPDESTSFLITQNEIEFPAGWKVLHCIKGFQMVYTGDAIPVKPGAELVPLTEKDTPQMVSLTKLTNPGPFAPRTIEFGHYYGVFDGEQLVAMAGQRLNPQPYAEISAVCTHPDHLGKGYARQLLAFHINRIKAAGEIPFLHVRYNNDRAIKVYHDMGFETRREICFNYILKLNN